MTLNFILEHWEVKFSLSPPPISFPFSTNQPLFILDHRLQSLFTRDSCYTRGESKTLTQGAQSSHLFIASLYFTFTCHQNLLC